MLSVGRCCCSSTWRDHPSGPDPRVEGLGTSCSAITAPHSRGSPAPCGDRQAGRRVGDGAGESQERGANSAQPRGTSLHCCGAHAAGDKGPPPRDSWLMAQPHPPVPHLTTCCKTTARPERAPGELLAPCQPGLHRQPGDPRVPRGGVSCPRGRVAQAAGTRELGVQVWE